jgi:beta-mannosidase
MTDLPGVVDLSGTWRGQLVHASRRLDEQDPDVDDGSWPEVRVPGHWRSDPAFADSDGPVVYRTSFSDPFPAAGPEDRAWLVLDGIFYTSDVWLDGTYLGDTEGYFFAHELEVTHLVGGAAEARAEHALAVEVACSPPADLHAKRALTGVFHDSDLIDRDANPGGIWRPVRLEPSGPVRVRHWRVRCRDATDQVATLALRVVLDTREARSVELITRVVPSGSASSLDGREHRRSQALAAGENRVEWTVNIPQPRRWWPRALGDQPLYDVEVEVRTESGDLSDRRRRRTGLRTVELRDWITFVNGERLFLKGANVGPTRAALAEASPAEVAADVALAADAGLDFLRVHAHVARPELYDAADEAGMLLWQDLPLQRGYSRSVRAQARRQAREAVDLLAHHPSVFLWCGHNEPARGRAAQALPTWNRTLLDHTVKSVLERNDGTRPVVAHSGVLPHPPQLEGTDSHLYFGWERGEDRDLGPFLARWPRLGRFVSELGAAAVPDDDDFIDSARWPSLDWERLERHHGLRKASFDEYVPPAGYGTYEAWKAATQAYQARLLRYQVETLRRLKYRPTGGFAQFVLADAAPAVTCAVLDHRRSPKPGYKALAAACQSVIVVADRPPPHVHPGDQLRLEVHVVSDDRIAYGDTIVRAHLSWTEGGKEEVRHVWTWRGDIPADDCVRVGALVFEVPDIDDALVIDLELEGVGVSYRSRYGTFVASHASH